MNDQDQPEEPDVTRYRDGGTTEHPTWAAAEADGLLELSRLDQVEARRRDPAIDDLLGPAGTTDPRADLIRVDPGRHAANRGPTFEQNDARLMWRGSGGPTYEINYGVQAPGVLIHRCPEPPESHEGWWAAVGLAAGFLLASLAWWVVLTW